LLFFEVSLQLTRGRPGRTLFPYTTLFRSLAVGLDVGRDQRGGAGRAERQADVAGREHLGGELAEGLPELAAEQCATERGHHRLRSEEHTSELQSQSKIVCRLLLGKKKKTQ